MHPTLLKAVKSAKKHIQSHANPAQNTQKKLKNKLEKLDKAQLIEYILAEELKSVPTVKIETIVYAILTDPDCAWLTWDTIAALITSLVPESKTTASSLQWYPSQGTKKGLDIVSRKPMREIAAMLTLP